jgi:hypothetical protein
VQQQLQGFPRGASVLISGPTIEMAVRWWDAASLGQTCRILPSTSEMD